MGVSWLLGREQRLLIEEVKAHRARLYRLAFAWCHDSVLADDLAQEAIVRGLSAIDQLRDSACLRSWLFTILHRSWVDHLRGQREHLDEEALADLPCDQPGPDARAERQETVTRVRAAIDALPLGQRQVLTLVDLEELSYAEVATVLAIPIGTVMSRLCRARNALRGLLAERQATGGTLRRVK